MGRVRVIGVIGVIGVISVIAPDFRARPRHPGRDSWRASTLSRYEA
jgi:hypothetical protein